MGAALPDQTLFAGVSEEDVAAFRASGQFDESWYLNEYPDVAKTGIDPARHYLWIGRKLGRRPTSVTASIAREMPVSGVGGSAHSNLAYETTWHEAFAVAQGARSPNFAPRAITAVQKKAGLPKLVAFYLPQFHPFKENDEWWGRGFTEWTNVSKAVPQYRGHYQPRLPLDLGFYDLRNIEIMREQVELAKLNGIDAFCFHYYWFDGKRLLEKPVENYLADAGRTLDLPYFLCWANENWTRRWDGSEADILMEQSHSLEDHENVFRDLNRFFTDQRYLKIDGKPIVVIYRPGIIKDLEAMVAIWRKAAVAAGFPGIHLVATNSFGFDDPGSIGFDALCEFPPHNVVAAERNNEKLWLNTAHEGRVYAYPEVVDYCTTRLNHLDGTQNAKNYYPTVMTSWDNEARKPGRGNSFDGCTPALLHRWLSECVDFSTRNHKPDQGLVFINAWNEWAEGTYLEPDRWLGHAYLWAVRAILEERQQPDLAVSEIIARANAAGGPRSNDGAICLHLFYPDLIDELGRYIDELRIANEALDLLISIPETWTRENVSRAITRLSPKRMFVTPNRGRDVLPFLTVAREAVRMGYRYGCKVHTKKSPHVRGGDRWRHGLYTSLLSVETARAARDVFLHDTSCGIYAASGMIKSCSDPSTMRDNLDNLDRIFSTLGSSAKGMSQFVAGTMFWFRFDALRMALDERFGSDWFGPELGAIDGTMAHAFERALVHLSSLAGYRLETYGENIFDPY
jgi:lipopolysaccharide biosynthesis protein